MRLLLLLPLLAACVEMREAEDPSDWYPDEQAYDVQEPVAFTDVNYAFPSDDADGIGTFAEAVFPVDSGPVGADQVAWGEEDASGDGDVRADDCPKLVVDELPKVVEGVATAHPRFYFKTSGCSWDSDEKYYGSFFIQDRTGGVFVLGDTKVAHFDMGDRIRLTLRAAKTSFDLDMVYAWSDLEILERGVPIYYQEATQPFASMTEDPQGEVWRVTGTVVTEKTTFGEFNIEDDAGNRFAVGLDVELNRRGVEYPVGSRITVTGPVLFSYSTYSIVIMRKGQVTVHDD